MRDTKASVVMSAARHYLEHPPKTSRCTYACTPVCTSHSFIRSQRTIIIWTIEPSSEVGLLTRATARFRQGLDGNVLSKNQCVWFRP